jgi:tetratricopeptide (TPR) repeat protein/predicted Ser/Thr protein kinase
MRSDPQVLELLEEMLDTGKTPEEICRTRPDLLPQVRLRWQEFCRVDAEIEALLPESDLSSRSGVSFAESPSAALPQIPGYKVEAVLGSGGMGVVFKARHRALDRTVAIKMLLAGSFAGPQELARFRREAEALAGLRHPNIVQVYDAGDIEGRPYFAMEFVEGGSLAQQLSAAPQHPRWAAELVATLTAAVQFAHRCGIVHRDLKPANILVSADGTPKITDFGVALSVAGGTRFTISGARVGTPSYMAPEQALGKASAMGPAVDIYALGAVLYELLTGRPPFVGETALDTERQVIATDPIPPSRLNAKVAPDLETICLKCLHKSPDRRYATAEELADDLHRFLEGRPVVARPVSPIERAARWAARRPALATLLVAVTLSLGAAVGLGVWLQHQAGLRRVEQTARAARAREAIETALKTAYDSARGEHWEQARSVLATANNHIPEADSDLLRRRLDQAATDVQFATELEKARVSFAVEPTATYFVMTTSYTDQLKAYAQAFQDARFDIADDGAAVAERIRAEPLADQIVAALDEWAFAAFQSKQEPLQKRLLRIAQLSDPDPSWRDRFRDPGVWADTRALLALAEQASRSQRPPGAQHLAILGALLRKLGRQGEEKELLLEALSRRPEEYWLNFEMAQALARDSHYVEAAEYWRVANALRPGNWRIVNQFGAALCMTGHFDEGIPELRRAVGLEPKEAILRANLMRALMKSGRPEAARDEFQIASQAYPNDPLIYHAFGAALFNENRIEESLPLLRKAVKLDPNELWLKGNFGLTLASLGRWDEAIPVLQETIRHRAGYISMHLALGQGLAAVGRYGEAIAEFQWVCRELERTGGPPTSGDPALWYVDARVGIINALTCAGRFAEGPEAARFLPALRLDQTRRRRAQRELEICRVLEPLTGKTDAILAAAQPSTDPAPLSTDAVQPPTDVAMQRSLAEWFYERRQTAASVRLYEAAFARQPTGTDDVSTGHRYCAACAAALAGCGTGTDASQLNDQQKAALRRKSLEWLKADWAVWDKRVRTNPAANRSQAALAMRSWEESKDLASVRTPEALSRLPQAESTDWRAFWTQVRDLAVLDPVVRLREARLLAGRREWARAVQMYAQIPHDSPCFDEHAWFEFAAVQLLSEDLPSYRRTCEEMLAAAVRGKVRPFLAARACTLSPNWLKDAEQPEQVSEAELQKNEGAFWSLTERGALKYRDRRYEKALVLFQRSLGAEPQPGCAVVDWLWLSLVYHRVGNSVNARSWLNKATSWLDGLGDQLPANGNSFKLDLHNWLEAHVLRREAQRVLATTPRNN